MSEKLQRTIARIRELLSSFRDSARQRASRLADQSGPSLGSLSEKLQGVGSPEWRERTKEIAAGLRAKLAANFNREAIRNHIQNFDPHAAGEWASRAFQREQAGFYGGILTVVLCAWFISDLSALLLGSLIPEPPVARITRNSTSGPRRKSVEDYNAIFARNLFNSQGLIPGEDTGGPVDNGGTPVRTTLPFNLIGTLILRNELRSIATIEDKSASMVYPVRVSDEIPSKARILSIEARRVVFINTSSGRREFIDLPEDLATSNARITLGAPKSKGASVEREGNNFTVARTEIDKAFGDLNNILTQARAVPNFENGQPAGYKLFQITPGSIYEKFGFQNGDVIAGVNGEPINDPGKAFELLGKLREGAGNIEITVKHDGKTETRSYNIH